MSFCPLFKVPYLYPRHRLALTCHRHTSDYFMHVAYINIHTLGQNLQAFIFASVECTGSENGVHYYMWLPVRRGVGGRGWLVCACVTGGPHLSTVLQRRGGDAIWQSDCHGGCACVCDRLDESLLCLHRCVPLEHPLVSDWWTWCMCCSVCVHYFILFFCIFLALYSEHINSWPLTHTVNNHIEPSKFLAI